MAESLTKTGRELVPTALLLLGVVFIVSSFLPLSSLAWHEWTVADSEAFGRVTRELHDATLQSPARSGRTVEERDRYLRNLERQFEKLNSKLEHAQQEPQRWSRILLWAGAGFTAIGALAHIAKR